MAILSLICCSGFAGAQLPFHASPQVTETGIDTWNFDWDGQSGITYFIQYSFDLQSWSYMPVIESGANVPIGYGFQSDDEKLFMRLHYTDAPTSSPHSDDFDSDGISNWDEVRVGGTGTSPLIADTNGDGIRDDGLVYAAQNDPDGAGLAAAFDVDLTGRWDFEQLNGNTYTNSADTNYHATIGGSVPVDNEGSISKAAQYDADGDWLKIDPRIFSQSTQNSISMWFCLENDFVQNKVTSIASARRTAFWSYNTVNSTTPQLVLSAFKAVNNLDQQKIILTTYNNGIQSDLIVALVPQDKFIDDAKWHQLTFV
ncbi:hypothetical protein JO972_00270 [Verrucomicrobiaceae bacterium 5K15]|uniref:Uncharacterized protein n=1 Tax=Oceaniferula flava TaxID=2800421 RepID=A0AAE2SAI8_9BACT|nr:hypothetical protein [Oceaniferula flavus]MBK1853382.1 hypothetical protein [Oceaniferula flavus]MBM1134687.1 hypothetical protein [Oceaniferula flavus]